MGASGRAPDAVLTAHDHCYQRFTRKHEGRRIPVLVNGAGGFAGYNDLTRVNAHMQPLPDVKFEEYEDEHPGFLRLTVEPEKLTGEYFTVPKVGKEKDPEKLRDRFVLDLKNHRLD
jgi:hypothetical protein